MDERAAGTSDTGRVRSNNEDAYLVQPPLFAVADGMGGENGGEVASHLAIEALERTLTNGAGENSLLAGVREANRAIWERASHDGNLVGMGTTLTAVYTAGDHLRIAHVGDSRAYRLRDDRLDQLTVDHSFVREMVSRGRISAAEAETHPNRNLLLRAVGASEEIEVDERVVETRADDRVMLCTDGLWGGVPDIEIARILQGGADPPETSAQLIRAALEAGGHDNVTVVVFDVGD